MPKVFISYSHDSEEHRQRVLDLADRLNKNHIDCEIDQYVNGSPEEGWPMWMENQLEQADFVLVVCTEIYLKRVKREERKNVGKGVKWESLLTYQEIYDNGGLNKKFIPLIFNVNDVSFIPNPLRPFTFHNLFDEKGYESLCRQLLDKPAAIKPKPEQELALPAKNNSSSSKQISPKFKLNRLPSTTGEFFGRKAEQELLDNALTNPQTAIIQFIAAGGTGKTKLLQHWLAQHKDLSLLAWSFYSQGASEDKQVSASPFFEALFDKLNAERRQFACDDDKGEYLAELLCRQPCVLVLDGLEPLQHAGKGMRGELKDKAIRALLRHLLGQNSGNKVLCVITSRLAVQDFDGRDGVVTHDLHQLDTASGKALLQALDVQGKDSELAKAVQEYGNHAFSLYLLGNALTYWLDGDICRRDQIGELLDPSGELRGSPHAFKMMQAYQHWFAGQTELTVLWLLGLFDHPIEKAVLRQLQQAQIEGLTAGLDEREFNRAVQSLIRDHHLLFSHENSADLLDCHPLIREFFGKRLQQHNPAAWQAAHEWLYHYYKDLPKKHQPDTLAEMQPLFHAVSHGCAAGLHQQVFGYVYGQRIHRGGKNYLCNNLGVVSDDLVLVAHFFTQTWQIPATALNEVAQATALNHAGFRLRSLGRLQEAVQPTQAGLKMRIQQKNWQEAAKDANNLSESLLGLGDIAAAMMQAQVSVDYADRSEDLFRRMVARGNQANILAQSGDGIGALDLFKQAEQMQQQLQPNYPLLSSIGIGLTH